MKLNVKIEIEKEEALQVIKDYILKKLPFSPEGYDITVETYYSNSYRAEITEKEKEVLTDAV